MIIFIGNNLSSEISGSFGTENTHYQKEKFGKIILYMVTPYES